MGGTEIQAKCLENNNKPTTKTESGSLCSHYLRDPKISIFFEVQFLPLLKKNRGSIVAPV